MLEQIFESDFVRIIAIPFVMGVLAGWYGHYNWQWFSSRERKNNRITGSR